MPKRIKHSPSSHFISAFLSKPHKVVPLPGKPWEQSCCALSAGQAPYPQASFAVSFCFQTRVSFLTTAAQGEFRAMLRRGREKADTETAGKFEQDRVPSLTSNEFT